MNDIFEKLLLKDDLKNDINNLKNKINKEFSSSKKIENLNFSFENYLDKELQNKNIADLFENKKNYFDGIKPIVEDIRKNLIKQSFKSSKGKC